MYQWIAYVQYRPIIDDRHAMPHGDITRLTHKDHEELTMFRDEGMRKVTMGWPGPVLLECIA